MKNVANVTTLCGALLLSTSAQALEYQWPLATKLDVQITGADTATYTLHMSRVTINDPRITSEDTLGSLVSKGIIEPTESGRYSWGTFMRHRVSATQDYAALNAMRGFDTTTLFTTVAEVVSRHGEGTETLYNNRPLGEECVGTALWRTGYWWGNFDIWLAATWNGGVGAAGRCLGTPPVNQWCALTTPAITFGYGTMNLTEARGTVKEATVGVSCTTGMKYTLRLRGEDSVPLSNGMRAELTADGKPLNSTINGTEGNQTVRLTSTLQGQPERTGDFRGESVLFVSYP